LYQSLPYCLDKLSACLLANLISRVIHLSVWEAGVSIWHQQNDIIAFRQSADAVNDDGDHTRWCLDLCRSTAIVNAVLSTPLTFQARSHCRTESGLANIGVSYRNDYKNPTETELSTTISDKQWLGGVCVVCHLIWSAHACTYFSQARPETDEVIPKRINLIKIPLSNVCFLFISLVI